MKQSQYIATGDVPADGTALGEVMFRGNVVMKGYLKNPKATDEAFGGGWFHSGDLGVMHPDGYVQLKDRAKDIITSGGENISSIEVEDTLYKHPAVQSVAVVAKPDDKWGETPCAFVELREDRSARAHASEPHDMLDRRDWALEQATQSPSAASAVPRRDRTATSSAESVGMFSISLITDQPSVVVTRARGIKSGEAVGSVQLGFLS